MNCGTVSEHHTIGTEQNAAQALRPAEQELARMEPSVCVIASKHPCFHDSKLRNVTRQRTDSLIICDDLVPFVYSDYQRFISSCSDRRTVLANGSGLKLASAKPCKSGAQTGGRQAMLQRNCLRWRDLKTQAVRQRVSC